MPKLDAKPTTCRFTLQQARNDFQMSSSSGPTGSCWPSRSECWRAHGRSFEVESLGPAATAASRRTCGGWAETGLGQELLRIGLDAYTG